jgi:haloacetate dehalogenase
MLHTALQHFNGPVGRMAFRTLGNPSLPPLVLLHGFPQTHAMWARVALALQDRFFMVAPDLRGYGDSAKPADAPEHVQQSKRAMANDVIALADHLQLGAFNLCGHDRGGRVAHRLALDHASRVRKLCVIDIAPTLDMYDRTDMAFARAYYHWFHLIQPAPLPERMIAPTPEAARAYLHTKLGGWGGAGTGFVEAAAMAEYERCFVPETIHTMCEDYRASAGIDLAHDRESRASGHTVQCPTLVLWGERGVVHKLFKPLALWQAQCAQPVLGQALAAGHFIPEEQPQATAHALGEFFC